MTLGQRVAVMQDGRIQQVDPRRAAVRGAGEPLRRRVHRLARDEPESRPAWAATRSRRPVDPPRPRAAAPVRSRRAGNRRDPPGGASRTPPSRPRPTAARGGVDVIEELGSDAHLFFELAAPSRSWSKRQRPTRRARTRACSRRVDARFTARVDARTKVRVGDTVSLAVDPRLLLAGDGREPPPPRGVAPACSATSTPTGLATDVRWRRLAHRWSASAWPRSTGSSRCRVIRGADDRVGRNRALVGRRERPGRDGCITLARLGVEVAFSRRIGDETQPAKAIRDKPRRRRRRGRGSGGRPGQHRPQSSITRHRRGSELIVHYPGPLASAPSASRPERTRPDMHADHASYPVVPGGLRLSVDGGNPTPGLDLSGSRSMPDGGGDRGRSGDRRRTRHRHARGAQGCTAYTAEGDVVGARRPFEGLVTGAGNRHVFHGVAGRLPGRGMPASQRTEVRQPGGSNLLPSARRALRDPR